jgi:hypothetical protein
MGVDAHRDRGPELLRSLVWAMNDESGTNGVYALGAVGEIGRRAPDMVEPFMGCLVPLAEDDGLRLELLRAFARIAEEAPDVVAPFLSHLERQATPDEERELEDLRSLIEGASGG